VSERSVIVRIKAEIGDFRKNMAEASKVTAEVGKTATETAAKSTTALGQMVQSADRHERAWSTSGAALLGFGTAVSVGVGLAIKSYAEFDKSMSEVKAATHASAGDMELLRTAAIKAGADTSYSAKEAADAITELSKAGVSTKEILGGGLAGALSLAAAGGIEVAEAAELAATAMTQFKLKGDQIPHLADLLAAGAGKAQGSVQDLGAALGQSGLVAASTGLSIEETTGGLAAFASAGLLGSDAGTSFKTMLQSLTPNSAAAASEMQRLGINAYDANGKFIGLSKFAGNLKDSMKGLSDEQRNASMKIIFGSDAVRAANVLYEQGAKGIADWTTKVNESGYAASTAAIKQDNLAGDIEKVGGSLDSVFLKSGSGANEVLRGLTQGADRLIDSIGQLPTPLLQSGLGLTALAGGSALVVGGFVTMFPKVIEARKAFDEMKISNEKGATALGKVGKAAGIAAIALAGLQIAGAIQKSWAPGAKTIEDFAQATLDSATSIDSLNTIFRENEIGVEVKGIGEALLRLNDNLVFDNINNFVGDLAGGTSATQRMRDNLRGLDQQLGVLTKGGAGDKAGKVFQQIREETDKTADAQGRARLSTADLLKQVPEYTAALKAQASALGVKLEQHELEEMALGKIPARLAAVTATSEGQAKAAEFQAKATEEATKKLEEMGLGADGAVLSLSKLLDAMFATGLATMSARDAEAAYQESLDGLQAKIQEVMATQTAGNAVWDEAKGSFDVTSEAGRAANAVFGDLQQSAINTTTAMANAGASQPDLQAKLGETYKSLYDTARAFGASEEKADALARSALGIPKNVDINTAIQNYADTIAKAHGVKEAVEAIPTRIGTTHFLTTDSSGFIDPRNMPGKITGPTAFANGGIVRAFADGGLVHAANGLKRESMIAKGGANILWAEPETGWEAYISGKPGQESRNKAILAEIAPRFGLEVSARHGDNAPSKSMAGGHGAVHSFSGFNPGTHASRSSDPAAGAGIYIDKVELNEQSDPRATFMEFNRDMKRRRV
jgi:TP901 family phage tail tape measure protein